jgi:Fic family protein
MATYIWQHPDWPNWRYDITRLAAPLATVRHAQGRLLGRMESLGFKLRDEAWLQTLTQDVVKTSEIEGERLDTEQVRFINRPASGLGHRRFGACRPSCRRHCRDDA